MPPKRSSRIADKASERVHVPQQRLPVPAPSMQPGARKRGGQRMDQTRQAQQLLHITPDLFAEDSSPPASPDVSQLWEVPAAKRPALEPPTQHAAAAPQVAFEVLFAKLQDMEAKFDKAANQIPMQPVPAVPAFKDHALQAIAETAVEGIKDNLTEGPLRAKYEAKFKACLVLEKLELDHVEMSKSSVVHDFRAAVPLVAVFTKSLYECLRLLPLCESGWVDFDEKVLLSCAALAECDFWYRRVKIWNGFPVRPRTVSRVLYTDGSGYGYAGVLHRVAHRTLEPAFQFTSGVWDTLVSSDSVYTELQGLWRSLVAAGAAVVGHTVLRRTDSISTYWVLRNGGSRSQRLTVVAKRVVLYCAVHNIHLAMEYVGAGVVIKSGADALSRACDETECRLNPGVYRRLWRLFDGWDVDMFASGGSRQVNPVCGAVLPYWALYADGAAEGIDALSTAWVGRRNYAFPPVKVVGQVLELLLEQRATTVLIAPKWQAQWWWALLQQFAVVIVDLDTLLSEGSLFGEVRGNGLWHPLGKAAKAPGSTTWVAAYFKF